MLIHRSDLRLALVAGLTNGLGVVSGIPFSYYAPMAVLAVCSGSYGNTLELGRQRLLGSLLGAAMLVIGLKGLQHLPLPVALAISLGALRLLGGVFGLRVGYKVAGFVVVMGWLVHRQTVLEWLPLRLVWTAIGIVLASLSLRLLWPARAIVGCETAMASLIERLAACMAGAAADHFASSPGTDAAGPRLDSVGLAPTAAEAGAQVASPTTGPSAQSVVPHPAQTENLVASLQAIRRSLPQAQQELGANPDRHPRIRLLRLLDGSCSQLIGLYDELARQPLPPIRSRNWEEVPLVEAALLQDLSQRLAGWVVALRQPQRHSWPPPPSAALNPVHAWQRLETLLQRRDLPEPELPELQRHAAFLALLGLAVQQLNDTEQRWRELGRPA